MDEPINKKTQILKRESGEYHESHPGSLVQDIFKPRNTQNTRNFWRGFGLEVPDSEPSISVFSVYSAVQKFI